MKEERVFLGKYFIFFLSSKVYTPSMFLKCRGMGWDLVGFVTRQRIDSVTASGQQETMLQC